METTAINQKAPDFKLTATGDKTVSLSDLTGKNVVLYFYPKDATPGCTTEGCDFRDLHNEFQKLNTVILGISRDNIKSHEKFKTAQTFPFDLLADINEEVCNAYDVIKMKNMYGKQVRGIERSTFLIDKTGKLVKEWRKVKVEGHVDEVLDAVKELA